MSANTYDAIVIGSGISGGWAAKELTEKGLKTIMLERGRNIEHIKADRFAGRTPAGALPETKGGFRERAAHAIAGRKPAGLCHRSAL
ncbi:MAG: Fructose dehydrogenase large subunit, partial [Mucilaginibacter sp.]|nr:Fructose dehydrogenase large subunit [Mucilaginibacter sp.]